MSARRLSGGNGATQRLTQPLNELGMLMKQAKAFFPNQEIEEGTSDLYLKAWGEIAGKYKMHRFETALWNVLRKSAFFPLPYAIEEECRETKILAEELPGSRMKVWHCPACGYRCAGQRLPDRCKECSAAMMLHGDPADSTPVEMRKFYERQKTHPEEFFSVAELAEELATKRANLGKADRKVAA